MFPLGKPMKVFLYVIVFVTLIIGFFGTMFGDDTHVESTMWLLKAFAFIIVLGLDELYVEILKNRRAPDNK